MVNAGLIVAMLVLDYVHVSTTETPTIFMTTFELVSGDTNRTIYTTAPLPTPDDKEEPFDLEALEKMN